MNGYQTLAVWQESFNLAKEICILTKSFPKEERYELTSQMRRAAVSIPSNLAEGYRRKSQGNLEQFTRIAYGSAAELETQILLAKELGYLSEIDFRNLWTKIDRVLRLLNGYSKYISKA